LINDFSANGKEKTLPRYTSGFYNGLRNKIHENRSLNGCFYSMLQCNEPRADDAPPADIALSNPPSLGKKGFEAGWFEMLLFS
jgi:hypothetical protein